MRSQGKKWFRDEWALHLKLGQDRLQAIAKEAQNHLNNHYVITMVCNLL
jgi:hypothetical protein